ncbi:hypothetical protein ACH5RR_003914 [Cinchona calisaya]|uniref:Homeobox domain-containing protein n=1 Tax=Cinchona calisaya TaxID=153742 RepID=A0ABD3AWD2_9GENT
MGDDDICNTKLALGIGSSSGKSLPKPDKHVFSLDLSLVDEGQSSRNSEENVGESRKKLRLSKEQSAVLEDSFKEHTTLNTGQKNELAAMLGLKPRQVEVWFQNRRARTKLKQTETNCELWKRHCESLSEENSKLQKEIEELKALRAVFYAQLTNCVAISVCPKCMTIEKAPIKGNGDGKQPVAEAARNPKYKRSGLKIRG